MSINNQFVEFNDRVVKRYVKTVLYRVSGYRSDPHRPENRIDFLLITPERDVEIIPQPEGQPIVRQKTFSYDDEVLELYSDTEVKVFERWNRSLFDKGLIKEYTLPPPEIDSVNMLSDDQVNEIALSRQIPVLRKRLKSISSSISLNRIKAAAIDLNRSVNIIKVIEERINELSNSN